MNENTNDLSKLGFREVDQLADLLKTYAENGAEFLNSGVNWEYNPMSDNLFLVDEDYNVGMMNGDKLEQWFNCSNCGSEGFAEDIKTTEEGKCNHCEHISDVATTFATNL